MEMKNRSHRYDVYRLKSNHGHKNSKYKKCLTKMLFISRKFYIRRNNNKVDSIKTGRIVIADLLL